MNYYQHNLNDYASATRHLSWDEDAAYRRLIEIYYMREEPLPLDRKQICRLILAKTPEQQAAVDMVLVEFFTEKSDGWHNADIDLDIARFRARPDAATWAELRCLIFKRDDYTCQYCYKRGGNLECDHIVPAAHGGPAIESNLITSCRPCNRSKGAKKLSDWAAK